MINVEVSKAGTENTQSLIRRFTKRMQGSGVLPRVRKNRFHSRQSSVFAKKKGALRKISRRKNYEQLVKLGKVSEQTRQRRR